MANPYAQRWDKYRPDWKKVEGKRSDPRQEAEARKRADWLGMAGAAAPVVGGIGGTLIGGLVGSAAGGVGAVPGAAAGAGIGTALGGAAGTALGAGADSQTREYDEEEAKRRARYETIAALLGPM